VAHTPGLRKRNFIAMLQPILLAVLFSILYLRPAAQPVAEKLRTAFQKFENDPQLQAATASLCVLDKEGKAVFQKNASVGLAPASTQKVVTAATAYALLGKTFRYKTVFGFLKGNNGTSSLYIRGTGDPTLGSPRWERTAGKAVLQRVVAAANGIIPDNVVYVETTGWEGERIPNGWIWEDIGNYYGAGAGVLNWCENQYDLYLRSGTGLGSPVIITGTNPELYQYKLLSKAAAAAKGSGDNAYIYFQGAEGVVRGTIPAGEARFVISGALPQPERQFAASLLKCLQRTSSYPEFEMIQTEPLQNIQWFHTETSPPLDSIVYWLNRKSINLYGEALLRTQAFQQTGTGDAEQGMDILKSFWKKQGIPGTALNLVDGSGLSPLNRITTSAQATVLHFARSQSWFPGFYLSLPEYNGMKLKSGTIRDTKGFAGYHTSRSGTVYTISFLVNNYNGAAAELVKKMFAVLDVLK
jgi:D-alanyl-D-alanine carboxypeptidase/D-alanyl-D-alanine-endopeptidase (penicillin-binding protein 4)